MRKGLAVIWSHGLVAIILGGQAGAASPKSTPTGPAQATQTAFPGTY